MAKDGPWMIRATNEPALVIIETAPEHSLLATLGEGRGRTLDFIC